MSRGFLDRWEVDYKITKASVLGCIRVDSIQRLYEDRRWLIAADHPRC